MSIITNDLMSPWKELCLEGDFPRLGASLGDFHGPFFAQLDRDQLLLWQTCDVSP